jgi:phosphatidylglycerol:prolipoprotein diacylglycerol transferase
MVFIYPEIDPIIFSIGFLKIRWYGLMYLFGFIAAILLAKKDVSEKTLQ